MGKYVAWDYEPPGVYHVYTIDEADEVMEDGSVLVRAHESEAMTAKITALVRAMDEVIALAIEGEP